MSTLTRVQSQSSSLTALKAGELTTASTDSESDSHDEQPSVIASNTRQVSAETSVTTLVMSSSDSQLPSLSLEDVLARSGVTDDATVILVTEDSDGVSSSDVVQSDSTPENGELTQESVEQIQDAIDAIESSSAVVVEVETTNNEQIVKVRAVDIVTVYTQASVPNADNQTSGMSNFLLLKNGWAYTDMQTSPLEMPVEPSGQEAGNGWVLWRAVEEGGHEIQDAITGLWNRVVGQVVDTSPKSAADVAGVFKSNSFDAQIIYTSSSRTSLELSPDGIFTNTRSSLTTNETGFLDATYTLATFSSAFAQSSSFSGSADSNGSTVAAVSSSDAASVIAGDMFGSYRILEDGITLELQFADGSVQQQLFLRTTQGNLTIGGQSFGRYGDAPTNLVQDLMDMLMAMEDGDLRTKLLKALAKSIEKIANAVPQPEARGDSLAAVSSNK